MIPGLLQDNDAHFLRRPRRQPSGSFNSRRRHSLGGRHTYVISVSQTGKRSCEQAAIFSDITSVSVYRRTAPQQPEPPPCEAGQKI